MTRKPIILATAKALFDTRPEAINFRTNLSFDVTHSSPELKNPRSSACVCTAIAGKMVEFASGMESFVEHEVEFQNTRIEASDGEIVYLTTDVSTERTDCNSYKVTVNFYAVDSRAKRVLTSDGDIEIILPDDSIVFQAVDG